MSCLACEAAQELHGAGRDTRAAYVRVGNGNVELVGCVDHVAELVKERRGNGAGADMAERAQRALTTIERVGPVEHHEAALALDFTRALFAATTYLGELEGLAATLARGAALVHQYHPGLLDGLPVEPQPGEEDPPDPVEPAADCLNCDGSGCEDCRPVWVVGDE